MFNRLIEWVKKVLKMFTGEDIKKAVQAEVVVSSEMAAALTLWAQMYENEGPWLDETTKSLNLPAAIASELARMVTIEMKSEISGSPRADYLNTQYAAVVKDMRRYAEYACAKGGLILKPYIDNKAIAVDYIQADCFFPTAFDSSGRITGAVFVDQIKRGNRIYTRLEYHNMAEAGCYISNMAYSSNNDSTLGSQINLDSVDEWQGLEPQVLIRNIDRPLFAYFKMPFANTIDPRSPLGVSVYSRATELIEEADRQYSRLLWEMESGERALFVNDTAFKRDDDGRIRLPHKRLYRTLTSDDESLFEDWTPDLREENILRGLDAVLIKIEDACGLARGTLSNPQVEAKTATELKIMKQRSYATVSDTQKALRDALKDLIYGMDVWATLGGLAPAGKYETAFEFDDSIVADRQLEYVERQQLVTTGVSPKYELRMWYFGETEEQAKKMVAEAEGAEPDLFGGAGGASG